jgi:hypothetical protein
MPLGSAVGVAVVAERVGAVPAPLIHKRRRCRSMATRGLAGRRKGELRDEWDGHPTSLDFEVQVLRWLGRPVWVNLRPALPFSLGQHSNP